MSETVRFCPKCGTTTWHVSGVCEWSDCHKKWRQGDRVMIAIGDDRTPGLVAASGVADSEEAASAKIAWPFRGAVEEALQAGLLNPWCAICKAGCETWRYEVGRTKFRTMEEAAPLLQRLEDEQAVTRAVFGDMKRSD